jgi:hypothetical protein
MKVMDYISKGNKKLPATTWIFNAGSATDCPSKKLGLCQCVIDGKNKCYAKRPEDFRPSVLPYRRAQGKLWKRVNPVEFTDQLLSASKRSKTKPMHCFRFNEAGDFKNQAQLDWFVVVCSILKYNGIKCYGYTARTDLNLSQLLKVASVNVSNDLGSWITKGANRFRMVQEYSGTAPRCAGNCRKCTLCLDVQGTEIEIQTH